MSDNEKGAADGDDVGLPRATVGKLVQELLPPETVCAKDTKELIAECCKEFITLISSEANDICEKEAKKTISPEHIIAALKQLGFASYVGAMEEITKEHKTASKETQKKRSKLEDSGFTEAELLEQQERLFAESRARFEAAGNA